jgi:bacteriorhodopsin
MKNLIFRTGIFSLIIQIITGVFDYYVLGLYVPSSLLLLKSLLWLEFFVQIIEGAFYVWMVTNFSKIVDITHFRYYDWFITTPTMLFTYSFYLLYLKYKAENKEIEKNIYELVQENLGVLIPVIVLNALMLVFGYLGEIKKMSKYLAAFLGFIPFILMFSIIYNNYAVFSNDGIKTFWYFCGIWSLYGVASVLPYDIKNIMYNILDLFAKNFFGIFLAFILFFANRQVETTINTKDTNV